MEQTEEVGDIGTTDSTGDMVRMAQNTAEDVGEWHKDSTQCLGWHRRQQCMVRMAQQTAEYHGADT